MSRTSLEKCDNRPPQQNQTENMTGAMLCAIGHTFKRDLHLLFTYPSKAWSVVVGHWVMTSWSFLDRKRCKTPLFWVWSIENDEKCTFSMFLLKRSRKVSICISFYPNVKCKIDKLFWCVTHWFYHVHYIT